MTELEWQEATGKKVIEYIIDEIYKELPFMGVALTGLVPVASPERESYSTDGNVLYFPTEKYLRLFETNELYLKRAYLHVILHCLYGHLWLRGGRNKKIYDLACDICIEKAIDEVDKPGLKRILTWSRLRLYEKMDTEKLISPIQLYEELLRESDEALAVLAIEFHVDDHDKWPMEEESKMPMPGQAPDINEKKWQQLARQTKLNKDRSNDKEEIADRLLAHIKTEKRKMKYRDFLKKFARPREEVKLSDDEFDLSYYSLGLRTYGNVPLIEPLESRESHLLRTFVVAIDTSASTSGELVKKFLVETAHILLEDVYSNDAKIYLLQCDDAVRDEKIITKNCEIERFFAEYELVGGGSTDFRSVFDYVNDKVDDGLMPVPDGLLYFTDGQGKYPKTAPRFKTAFIYLEDYDASEVPVWAIRYSNYKDHE